jgi:hypothetical protein
MKRSEVAPPLADAACPPPVLITTKASDLCKGSERSVTVMSPSSGQEDADLTRAGIGTNDR